jgi:hypothetical protein
MPCQSDYLEPTGREKESARVIEFLHEIHGDEYNHEKPRRPYGEVDMLDKHTDTLCEWCKANDVTKASLELQLWWNRHKAADARRIKEREEEVNDDIRHSIKLLKKALSERYGADYTFIVCGHGKALAARTLLEGDLTETELVKVDNGKVELKIGGKRG